MNNKTLMHSSILAAVIIAALIGVGMVTGFPGAKPWISVDPLSDTNIGDRIIINGTTNLPAGTELMVQVYATSFEKKTSDTGEFSGAMGTVDVVSGPGGTNTWSMNVDTSVFAPVEYVVNASVFPGNSGKADFSTGSPFGTTTFTVHPGPGTAGTPGSSDNGVAAGILINPIRDTPQGKVLEVTGKTNLSAGTSLLVKVIPASMDNETIISNYQNPENVAVIRVEKGDAINNRFSVLLDTRFLTRADHIILISVMKDEAAGINSEPARLTGTAIFNIIAPAAGTNSSRSDLSVPSIFINPVYDVPAGDPITVNGMTNVPVGAKFRIFVLPADSTAIKVPENAVTISAVKGSPIANLFTTTLATKGLAPGQYILYVSAEDYEVTGTLLFTILA